MGKDPNHSYPGKQNIFQGNLTKCDSVQHAVQNNSIKGKI